MSHSVQSTDATLHDQMEDNNDSSNSCESILGCCFSCWCCCCVGYAPAMWNCGGTGSQQRKAKGKGYSGGWWFLSPKKRKEHKNFEEQILKEAMAARQKAQSGELPPAKQSQGSNDGPSISRKSQGDASRKSKGEAIPMQVVDKQPGAAKSMESRRSQADVGQ